MKNTKALCCLFFLLTAQASTAVAEPGISELKVPGGVAIVPLPFKGTGKPLVTYLGNRVLVQKNQDSWYAVVGLGLKTKPGVHVLTYSSEQKESVNFSVSHKKYPTQHVNGVSNSKVNLSDADYRRHLGEKKLINAAKKTWRELDMDSLSLALPVKSRISGLFGRRRVFNKQPRSPHSGLDLAAPKGAPVYAPASGKVVLTGDYFFLGNTVFIEHGQGLITLYAHLNKILVEKGSLVEQGSLIAEVGATGRASGPHLHWGVYLNQVAVDPLLFIDESTAAQLVAGKTVEAQTRSLSGKDYKLPSKS